MSRLPRVEIDIRTLTYRFYVADDDQYDSSLQMTLSGEDAGIHTLNGKRFFELIPYVHEVIFPDGIKYVHFEMMAGTLRALKKYGKDYFIFDIYGTMAKGKRTFYKVKIELKNPRKTVPIKLTHDHIVVELAEPA